eukprot:m.218591 g.218591  ORF g.218591 m.218591 type:complete len:66 (+) comp39900_c1_seq9:3396-3593(+)
MIESWQSLSNRQKKTVDQTACGHSNPDVFRDTTAPTLPRVRVLFVPRGRIRPPLGRRRVYFVPKE